MATLDRSGQRPSGGAGRVRFVLLLGFAGAAVVAAALIWGLLTLLLGPLPTWLWWGVLALQIVPAMFLAGAMFVSSEPECVEVS